MYPKWNFYKYLINRDGQVVEVFSSMTNPKSGKIVIADSAVKRTLR
ncbi:hypothetical protein Thiosp_03844 [Thiorhodovibrio litoralis]|nr:hypothetical protein Thiosp_03844 [Thiorhodovibrio litoralis]